MSKGIFFDLDGTLVDSAPDLAAAINQVLIHEGREPLDYQLIRPWVSGGSPALIKLGFDFSTSHPDFGRLKNLFLTYYAKNICEQSHFFEGVEDCISWLQLEQIPWGIITNKPDYLTQALLTKLELPGVPNIVISGDTYPVNKPDPFPLVEACRLTNTNANQSIYVGDDERDIIAAKAAKMTSVAAEWGYLSDQDPGDWQADHRLNHSRFLKAFLQDWLGQ